jgi:hypothetical protein
MLASARESKPHRAQSHHAVGRLQTSQDIEANQAAGIAIVAPAISQRDQGLRMNVYESATALRPSKIPITNNPSEEPTDRYLHKLNPSAPAYKARASRFSWTPAGASMTPVRFMAEYG